MASRVLKTGDGKTRPPNAGKGRVKGVPNKFTGALKEMVREALDEAGGVGYLKTQATKNPVAFMTLVGKLLPAEIKADVEHGGKVTIEIVKFAG